MRAPETSWMALILRPLRPITVPIRLCEMRRRIEVCGDDDESETGGGLEVTSWAMMRLYACRRREFVSETGQIKGDTYFCNCVDRSSNSEDPFVDPRYDFADASFHASLLPEICNIFSTLSNDYAGFLCCYEGAEGEDVVGGGR